MKSNLIFTATVALAVTIALSVGGGGRNAIAVPVTPGPAVYADPGPDVGDELLPTQQKALTAIRSQEGAPAWECGGLTASTTPTAIAGRAGRRGITIRNLDTTNLVYIGQDAATATSMVFPLNPLDSFPLDTTAAVYVYAPTGSPKVSWASTYTPPAVNAGVTVQPPVIH